MKVKLELEIDFEDWGEVSILDTNMIKFFNENVLIDPMICGDPETTEISIDKYEFKNIEIIE